MAKRLKFDRDMGDEKTMEKTRVETREKTREKIIAIIKENPTITIQESADLLEITTKGVEWNLKKLKAEGIIKRIGPDKGGYWEIIEK